MKLARELAVGGVFLFFHLERRFMHLGFHIYDVGFPSRNSEAGKPPMFVTTLLSMDEPCFALDPVATAKIEELIDQPTGLYTIVIVTHNLQ